MIIGFFSLQMTRSKTYSSKRHKDNLKAADMRLVVYSGKILSAFGWRVDCSGCIGTTAVAGITSRY